MSWEIIGILAAGLTTFSFVPQVFKVLRTRSVKDVSLFTLLQLATGVALWVVYGAYLRNAVIIVANSVTLLTLIVLITVYFIYRAA